MNSRFSGRSNRSPDFDEPTRTQLRQNNTDVETNENPTPAPATQDAAVESTGQPLVSNISRKKTEANIASEGVSTPANRVGDNLKSLNPPVNTIAQTTSTKPSTEVKNTPAETPEEFGQKDNTQLVQPKGQQPIATTLLEFPNGNRGSLFTRPDRADLIFPKQSRGLFNKPVEENTEVQQTRTGDLLR